MPISGKPEIGRGDPVFAKRTDCYFDRFWIPAFAAMSGRKLFHLKPDRQLLRAVDEGGLRHLHLAVERDQLQTRQQLLEQDAHLELGEILAEAEVRAVAEGEM